VITFLKVEDMKKTAVIWTGLNLLAAILSSGCTSTGDMDRQWVGRPASELVATLGEPDNDLTLEDGRKVLTWTYFEHPGQVVHCRLSCTISIQGIVEHFASSECSPERKPPFYKKVPGPLPWN